MAKAKVDPVIAAEAFALQAINSALANPTEPLFSGTTVKTKQAAALAVQRGWVTVVHQKLGKKTVTSYRITPAGINHALTNGEPVQLIRAMSESAKSCRSAIADITSMLGSLEEHLKSQTSVLERLVNRVIPPNLSELLSQPQFPSATPATAKAVDRETLAKSLFHYLHDFQRRANVGQFCTMKDLYLGAAQKLHVSIGEFHESLRELDRQRKIRLGAWTSPLYELNDESYAMIAGKEVKFYVYLDE